MRITPYLAGLLTIPLLLHAPTAAAATKLSRPATVQAATVPLPNVEFTVKDTKNLNSEAATPRLATAARAAVVMDFATGKVLFEKDAHEKLPLASVTKVMTLLLVMEALDSGKIHLKDPVQVSEHASSMGGSQIFLEPGERMTVEDMLKGIAMASANDACVVMAELLCGTEDEFVEEMNERAAQLQMNDSHFVNCNGLPANNHYSSAHDIALMSRELLKHPAITKYTAKYSDYLRQDSEHPFWLVNTNKLVRFYPGLDGLKTGYTTEAKYCLSATAKHDGFRVITVVLGEPKSTIRNKEVSEMLNWAFAQYQSKVLYPSGATIKEVEVAHGVPGRVALLTGETLGIIEHKGEKVNYSTNIQVKSLSAPLKKGQVVGKLVVDRAGEEVGSVPIVVAEEVRQVGFFEGFGRTVKKLVTFETA